MDIKKKRILYIGISALLLLLVILIVILISHANHQAANPDSVTPDTTVTPYTPQTTPVYSAAPSPTPSPSPSQALPAITPPASASVPSSGSDIVLTTAAPSTDTDIDPSAIPDPDGTQSKDQPTP